LVKHRVGILEEILSGIIKLWIIIVDDQVMVPGELCRDPDKREDIC